MITDVNSLYIIDYIILFYDCSIAHKAPCCCFYYHVFHITVWTCIFNGKLKKKNILAFRSYLVVNLYILNLNVHLELKGVLHLMSSLS